MSDFFQNGEITTLHRLTKDHLQTMEKELMVFSKHRPMALVLPCLFSELEGPALKNIIGEICKVPYLNDIIIGLDRATEEQFHYAKEFFSTLSRRKSCIQLSVLQRLLLSRCRR